MSESLESTPQDSQVYTALSFDSILPTLSPVPSVDDHLRGQSRAKSTDNSITVQDIQNSIIVNPIQDVKSLRDEGNYHASAAIAPTPPQPSSNRPFFVQEHRSEASLESVEVDESGQFRTDTDDMERLTPGEPETGLSRLSSSRSPSRRVYDAEGHVRSTGPMRVLLSRNQTLRDMSRTIRKASIRVVNIMGSDLPEGLVRLNTLDEDDGPIHESVPRSQPVEADTPHFLERSPADAEPALRGRTLCYFSSNSPLRKLLHTLILFPWTEPLILLLIMLNVAVLTIQASPPLYQTRSGDGYFQSWEDYVLLALFSVFSFEMLARIVVTGLILDPETSLRSFLFSSSSIWPTFRRITGRPHGDHQRPSLPKAIRSHDWQTRDTSTRGNEGRRAPPRPPLLSEVPFQQAVAKQQTLSTQGRPYLRHSWHRIDMIAIISFWISFVLAESHKETTDSAHIYLFRALSVLRTARLLVITSGTTTILHSLKRAGPLIITVAFFIIFAASLFSIIGVQSFRGSFRRDCILTDQFNHTNVIELSQSCGGWLNATTLSLSRYLNFDGSVSEINPKGYICPLNQVCKTTSEALSGNAESFDNIFAALVQVIVLASVNTWSSPMYSAMDSDFFSSALYFLVAVVVLNFWLINLLVAVVVNTFKDIRAETKRSAFGADETVIVTDPQWAMDNKRHQVSSLLRLYDRTHYIWVFFILSDIVTQGFKTAHSSANMINILYKFELVFTLVFDVEIIIRFVAFLPGWRLFFRDGRNNFDLFLAVACSVIQIPTISSANIYPWLTIFQLLRWYRVILAFPRMKPLLVTVFGSFAGLLNMVIFLFMVNFIGALMAVQLMRGDISEDSGTITFSQPYNAFLGMYQIFSSENWTTVLYDAMDAEFQWKQGWLVCIFLCGWFLFANFIVLQMFIAVINENFAVAEEQKRKQQIEAFVRRTEPNAIHHKAVRVDSLPQNLVFPLKQNIGADVGVPEKKDDDDQSAKGAMRRLLGLNTAEAAIPLRNLSRPWGTHTSDIRDENDDRGLTDLLPPVNAGPSIDEHMDVVRERRNQQADFIAAHPSFDRSVWIFGQNQPIRRFCQACVPPAYGDRIYGRPAHPMISIIFQGILFLTIVASVTVAAIATPLYRKTYYEVHGLHRGTWFDLSELALGAIFIVEFVIKVIADGFIFAPNAYLLSLWNVVDFLILVTLLVNISTSLIFIGGLSRVTRALKAFRALRLITLFARLRDTFHAVIFAGAMRIFDASILMILYVIPFAVWGLNIFSGLLYYCNDGDSAGKLDCTNEYLSSPLDDSLAFLTPRVWTNPSVDASVWAFDSFRQAVLILFEIVSLEGWIDVMSSVMTIAGLDQQPQDNASQWNAIFFVIFNLFGAVIILTLFLSIIIENFSSRSGNALLTTEQRQWVDLSKFIKRQTPSRLPRLRPDTRVRAWCYDRAVEKSGYWAQAFTLIYYVHILLLMTEDYSSNILSDSQLDWIFLGLTILYAIDLVVRFIGLGFNSFRSNGWNLFDLVVITGSFATTIPALQANSAGLPGNQVNVQLQKLFLVSISLKLVQRVDSLNQLFKTAVASLPAIVNLFLLWATLFIFFAIMFMEVFGLTKMGNNAYSRFQNYYSFGNAIVMLFFMSTGEGWNGYMHDYTVTFPRCTESSNYLVSDCGSSAWAYGLFISWNILSMYIFLNMFTGVVVESFAYVYQMPSGTSLNREQIRSFKSVWSEFDTERSGYIKRKEFVRFCSKLTGVFDVRLYPAEFSITNLMRSAVPDPVQNASGKLLVATGAHQAVDIRLLEARILQIDYHRVRQKRQLFARLYNEARLTEEPGKGISFTAMLTMLAHYKLIDDERALQLDDLLVRRQKTERVTDLVNLDRVRGLLRTIYWRRKFLASQFAKRRQLADEVDGIPTIVLEPISVTQLSQRQASSEDILADDPFFESSDTLTHVGATLSDQSIASRSPEIDFTARSHSPSLSIVTNRAPARRTSSETMLLSEDALLRRSSPSEESNSEDVYEAMAATVWGGMMREAVNQEDA